MRTTVRRRYQAHTRVNDICTEHSAFFLGANGAEQPRQDLRASVAEVARLTALQYRCRMEARAATEMARRARRTLHLMAKAIIAIGKLVPISGMAEMRLPGHVSDDELLADMRAKLEYVSPHAAAFLAAGLPSDLLDGFAGAIDALVEAKRTQDRARSTFTASVQSVRDEQKHSDRLVAALVAIADVAPDAPMEVPTRLRVAKRVGQRKAAAPVVQQPPAQAVVQTIAAEPVVEAPVATVAQPPVDVLNSETIVEALVVMRVVETPAEPVLDVPLAAAAVDAPALPPAPEVELMPRQSWFHGFFRLPLAMRVRRINAPRETRDGERIPDRAPRPFLTPRSR